MTSEETKANFLSSGFNCAQSVVVLFCEKYGVRREDALRLSGSFGGGVRCGEICGAVSGGAMVVGLKYGQSVPGDLAAKQLCAEKTVEFINAFRAKNKDITCRDLLGCDISTPEGKEEFQKKNLHNDRCANLVQSSIEILKQLGY